jgi:hypothetical protein
LRLDQLIILPAGPIWKTALRLDRLSAQDIGKAAYCQYENYYFRMDNPASLNFSSHALSVWQKESQFILAVVISKVRRAIVSLIDRRNIETPSSRAMCANGSASYSTLICQIRAGGSRPRGDYVFAAACVAQDLFRSQCARGPRQGRDQPDIVPFELVHPIAELRRWSAGVETSSLLGPRGRTSEPEPIICRRDDHRRAVMSLAEGVHPIPPTQSHLARRKKVA